MPKDEREAVRLYRLSADKGEAGAQYSLGTMYARGGGGLPKDEHEAARLYRLAADQDNAAAQAQLGAMYRSGRGGLPKDEQEAQRRSGLAGECRKGSFFSRLFSERARTRAQNCEAAENRN